MLYETDAQHKLRDISSSTEKITEATTGNLVMLFCPPLEADGRPTKSPFLIQDKSLLKGCFSLLLLTSGFSRGNLSVNYSINITELDNFSYDVVL